MTLYIYLIAEMCFETDTIVLKGVQLVKVAYIGKITYSFK